MKKSVSWGGKRAGAGRKSDSKTDPTSWKVTISGKISRHFKERLQIEAAESGLNVSGFLEKILSDHFIGQVAERPKKSMSDDLAAIKKRVLEKAFVVQPAAAGQALVSIRELRAAIGINDRSFDAAIMEMVSDGRLFIHKHIHPYRLTERDKEELVTDGQDNYYVGVVLR